MYSVSKSREPVSLNQSFSNISLKAFPCLRGTHVYTEGLGPQCKEGNSKFKVRLVLFRHLFKNVYYVPQHSHAYFNVNKMFWITFSQYTPQKEPLCFLWILKPAFHRQPPALVPHSSLRSSYPHQYQQAPSGGCGSSGYWVFLQCTMLPEKSSVSASISTCQHSFLFQLRLQHGCIILTWPLGPLFLLLEVLKSGATAGS